MKQQEISEKIVLPNNYEKVLEPLTAIANRDEIAGQHSAVWLEKKDLLAMYKKRCSAHKAFTEAYTQITQIEKEITLSNQHWQDSTLSL